jgi:hypothetical protein
MFMLLAEKKSSRPTGNFRHAIPIGFRIVDKCQFFKRNTFSRDRSFIEASKCAIGKLKIMRVIQFRRLFLSTIAP